MNLSPQSINADAAPPSDSLTLAPTLVRASAGTGKTYQLTARLLQILMQGAAPESVLATTFTRKAAGEILDRILLTLADAADPENEGALNAFRDQVKIPSVPHSMCEQTLKKLIANIHRLRIVTLDSLFTQLAKSFPFELQLPPAWRLTDEIEEGWIRERAINDVIASLSPGEMTTMLSLLSKGEIKRSVVREMMQVVSNTYTVSRGCAEDVWYKLAAPSMPDDETLAAAESAFRAADPPQKTIQKKFAKVVEHFEAGDFEEFAGDKLIENYVKARRTGDPVKLGRSALPDGLDDALGTLYAACRSKSLILLSAQNEGTSQVLQLYDQKVTELKTGLRTLSFDDIAFRLAEQFSGIDTQSLGRRMDGSIDHVLLDEFQDTSPVQWQVLLPFALRAADSGTTDSDGESVVPRSFFCVGDTKQAIYGWRGGVAEIFDSVADQIPGVKTEKQDLSYRSSPTIMKVVNDVFKNLKRHPMADAASEKDDARKEMYESAAICQFADTFPTHAAAKKDLSGYVRLESCQATGSPKEKLQEVYQCAAERIAELHRQSPDLTIGVLTRTNKAVAPLIFMLENLGVDVSQEGGNPLIDSAAVELVLSALMMVEHPGDKRWEYHVRQSPLGALFDAPQEDAEGAPALGADPIRLLLTEEGIARAVFKLCSLLAPHCSERDRSRLRQLVNLALSYETNATPRLRDFVQVVREKRVDRPRSAPVRVMNVHQSKGLEFDAVFLPELDGSLAGQPPTSVAERNALSEPPIAISRYLSSKAWHFLESSWRKAFGENSRSTLNESLCLLYVAMTRARQGLYLFVQSDSVDEKKTSASLIKSALSPALLNEPQEGGKSVLLYQDGDREWHAPS